VFTGTSYPQEFFGHSPEKYPKIEPRVNRRMMRVSSNALPPLTDGFQFDWLTPTIRDAPY
jgi:hypothetical protein